MKPPPDLPYCWIRPRPTGRTLGDMFGDDNAVEVARTLIGPAIPLDGRSWGALQVILNSDATVDLPVALLTHADSAVRIAAADALLARGDARGFEVLIAGLTATSSTDRSWVAATRSLCRWLADASMGPPTDATPRQVAAGQAAWREWWNQHRATVTFAGGAWAAA